jgi:tetratricopeptide (TPR) repeat protein
LKTFRLAAILLAVLAAQSLWADDNRPSPFSLTYYELYGTPVEPLDYTQIDTNALGFDILAEYNPSYYASFGLNYEKTTFYDGFNTTVSFLGLETRIFGAPNGKSPFAPYIYGGAGVGLNSGSGNQAKAGLGSRIQLYGPYMFLDFSAGSNWLDSGLQYLNFRGGLSLSFDLPKGEPGSAATPIPTATPIPAVTPSVTPTATAVNTIADILVNLATATPTITATPIDTVVFTPLDTAPPGSPESRVKIYYRAGMKAFDAHQYRSAIKNFKKAIAINDPSVQSYYHAESNAMLGVIYQFHLPTFTGHNKLAVIYYKRALKIDPMTKSAKKYLAMLQAPKKARKKRAAGSVVAEPTSAPSESNAATTTGSAPAASNNTQSIDLDTSTAGTGQQPAAQTTPAN